MRLLQWGAVLVLLVSACRPKAKVDGAPSSSAIEVRTVDAGPLPSVVTEPSTLVRQSKTVLVDGVSETWLLRWRSAPKALCVDKAWGICPCDGFAFGEIGDLDLVRQRPGMPEETLDLNSVGLQPSQLQKYTPITDGDLDKYEVATPEYEIRKRPVADVMKIGDYDHDGRATEFPFRVPVDGSCGHASTMYLVGITKKEPKLHEIVTANPSKDRIGLPQTGWDEVLAMKGGDKKGLQIIRLHCDDHGSDTEESTTIRFDQAGLHTKDVTRKCENE